MRLSTPVAASPSSAKCLLIATGAQYRRLDVEGIERFEGTGLYYAASAAEALLCRGCPVIVVGGGNSAGQAAVFLAGSREPGAATHSRRRPEQEYVELPSPSDRADREHRVTLQHGDPADGG